MSQPGHEAHGPTGNTDDSQRGRGLAHGRVTDGRAYALTAVELTLIALALDAPALAKWAAEYDNQEALRFLRATFGNPRHAVTIIVNG